MSSSRRTSKRSERRAADKHAALILAAIYRLARSDKILDARATDPRRAMLRDALLRRDTGIIYAWLAHTFSFQGVSDRVAVEYARRNGSPDWTTMAADLGPGPDCPKLRSFWHYDRCDYSKSRGTCTRPDKISGCPVPRMRLRNGRLNITSWSLFLFVKDVADGDLVGWLRKRIRRQPGIQRTIQQDRDQLLIPLGGVTGVSNKLLSMALADLLLAAPPRWRGWNRLGGSLIVIDSLVHNNLARTGILKRYRAEHRLGPACYQPRGCADVIDRVALSLGVSPRGATHAVWRYCALDGFNICNGNRINDLKRCKNIYCRLYGICDRRRLHVK